MATTTTQNETAYIVRKLKNRDLFWLTGLLRKLGKDAQQTIVELASTAGESDRTNIESGIAIANVILGYAEDEIRPWLADLVSMTPEEFDDLPFDASLTILETLAEENDLLGFFERARGLVTKFSGPNST